MPTSPRVVTFDLFSALTDSRTGGAAALQAVADREGWPVAGVDVYDRWDVLNKALQRDCRSWVPFAELSRQALARAYADLAVDGDADRDVAALLGSVGDWPLWPDVEPGLRALAADHRVGLLSNVDDEIVRRTRAAALVDHDLALTSEQLRAYKPSALIYRRAYERLGGSVHVASSARDVRGAAEAGVPFVRLRRPGHRTDPAGPPPEHEVDEIAALVAALARVTDRTPQEAARD